MEQLLQLVESATTACLPIVQAKHDGDVFSGFFFHPAGQSEQYADPGGLRRPFEHSTQSPLLMWCVGLIWLSANEYPAGQSVPGKRQQEREKIGKMI